MYERFQMSLGQFAPKRFMAALHVLTIIGVVFAAVFAVVAFAAGEWGHGLIRLVPPLLVFIMVRSLPWSAPEQNFVELRDSSLLLQVHSLPWPTTVEVQYASIAQVEPNVQHAGWLAKLGLRWMKKPHVDLRFRAARVRRGPFPGVAASRRVHLFLDDSDRFLARLTERMTASGSSADTP